MINILFVLSMSPKQQINTLSHLHCIFVHAEQEVPYFREAAAIKWPNTRLAQMQSTFDPHRSRLRKKCLDDDTHRWVFSGVFSFTHYCIRSVPPYPPHSFLIDYKDLKCCFIQTIQHKLWHHATRRSSEKVPRRVVPTPQWGVIN